MTLHRLPRTLRLDTSDLYVFKRAAEPGEWAVSGAFAFANSDPANLDAKDKLALANGWLGTESFGQSSLVEVAETGEAGYFAVVERLARHFVESYGAPGLAEALPVARAEVDDASELCTHKTGTLLAVERDFDERGQLLERFRVIRPERADDHAKIWEIVDD
ncbi:DUF6505 family protein [Algihabitans albus]|uniref:DUF6505 family protein n=1 Tax=Algihabitans albus TaxID=2164067 RepID=UPI000E5D8A39|nr:DUF6505 family protein [Algihabitans albus]